MSDQPSPPRENLIRAVMPGIEMRADGESDDAMPTLFGHFTPFNRWTEIDSFWEGRFMERIAPGAFKKTFREQIPKVLFQHGQDPQVGDKPLGPADVLREETEGPYYEVPMLDTSYNRDLIPGLEAGLYGASFRFSVMREEWVEEPGPSDDNPQGLPERTIKEARVPEFGPVTFPAYAEATAGVRSLTDDFIMRCFSRDPERLRQMFDEATSLRDKKGEDAPSEDGAESPADERREPDTQKPTAPPDEGTPPVKDYLHGAPSAPPWFLP